LSRKTVEIDAEFGQEQPHEEDVGPDLGLFMHGLLLATSAAAPGKNMCLMGSGRDSAESSYEYEYNIFLSS